MAVKTGRYPHRWKWHSRQHRFGSTERCWENHRPNIWATEDTCSLNQKKTKNLDVSCEDEFFSGFFALARIILLPTLETGSCHQNKEKYQYKHMSKGASLYLNRSSHKKCSKYPPIASTFSSIHCNTGKLISNSLSILFSWFLMGIHIS